MPHNRGSRRKPRYVGVVSYKGHTRWVGTHPSVAAYRQAEQERLIEPARRDRPRRRPAGPDRDGVRRRRDAPERQDHDELARGSACAEGDWAPREHRQANARGTQATRSRLRGPPARQLQPSGGADLGATPRAPRPAVCAPVLQPRPRPRPDRPQRLHTPGCPQAHTPGRPARLPGDQQRAIRAAAQVRSREPHRQLRADPGGRRSSRSARQPLRPGEIFALHHNDIDHTSWDHPRPPPAGPGERRRRLAQGRRAARSSR